MEFPSGTRENLTLSVAEIEAYKGPGKLSGGKLRFFCPIHGGDRQRSFELDPETGRFHCYSCQAWGYTDEARQRWADDKEAEKRGSRGEALSGRVKGSSAIRSIPSPPRPLLDPVPRPELFDLLMEYIEAFSGSPAEDYLRRRGISPDRARRLSIGYAAPGKWPGRNAPAGRIVFPHFIPGSITINDAGQTLPEIVNLYGRAIELTMDVPKGLRHDHLPGPKGWYNIGALQAVNQGDRLFVCEGPFDAATLIVAGVPRTVAIYGLNGLRWHWLQAVREIVLALDVDAAGQDVLAILRREARLRGKRVYFLEPADLGGAKDINEAWARGILNIRDQR